MMKTILPELTKALQGKASTVTIYWDTQDPQNIGPAYRTDEDSGALEYLHMVDANGKQLQPGEERGYNVTDFFGKDGRYLGPDVHGIYPLLEA